MRLVKTFMVTCV